MYRQSILLALIVGLQAPLHAQTNCPSPTGVSASPTTICLGSSITLQAGIPSGTSVINWYTTATGGTPFLTTSNNSASYVPTTTGTLTYYAEATDVSGSLVTNYSYTGAVQSVILQPGVYFIQSWGANGYTQNAGFDGKGGYAAGTLNVTAAQTYYIYVGGKGSYPTTGVTANTWTFNGGGIGYPNNNNSYGNGGGASDIRTVGGPWDDANSLANRLIVAGGGGAGRNATYIGGNGGGNTGGNGTYYTPDQTGGPTGGSQTAGGTNTGYTSGLTLATLGKAMTWNGATLTATFLAGGGGGYYGGGSGRVAGGGGSSYTGGLTAGITHMVGQTGFVSNPDANGNGYVRITAQSNCVPGPRVPVTITVNPKPTVTLQKTGNIGLCSGNSIRLQAGGGTFYTWIKDNQVIATSAPDTLIVTAVGAYRVVAHNAAGCTDTSAIANVVTSTYPVVNLGKDTSICEDKTIELNAQNPAMTYLWNTAATTQKITVSQPGSYSVKVTNMYDCTTYDTIVIGQYALPVIQIPADTAICESDTISLNAFNQNATYSWSTGSNNAAILVGDTGTYIITVTSNHGCITIDSTVVTVNPLPIVNLGPDQDLCLGNSLTVTAGNPGSTFLWNDNTTNMLKTIWNGGLYYVKVTDANTCYNTDTIIITDHNKPIINLGNDTTICANTPLVLDAANAGSTYIWNTNDTSQRIYVDSSNTYIVMVTDLFGCENADTIKVRSIPDPSTEGFSFIPKFFEQIGKVSFDPIKPLNITSYHWDFGDGASSTQVTPTHTYTKEGSYDVLLSVYNSCGSNTYQQQIKINLSTGIDHILEEALGLNMYPNPANTLINISVKEDMATISSLTVYNTIGQQIDYKQAIHAAQTQYSVAHLASGIYYLQITTSKGTIMQKLEVLK